MEHYVGFIGIGRTLFILSVAAMLIVVPGPLLWALVAYSAITGVCRAV